MSSCGPPVSSYPQAIFFDLDGTLLDSLPGIAFSIRQAFAVCGLSMQPIDLRAVIGPPIRAILNLAAPDATPSELDLLESAFRRSYDSEGWQETLSFPGASQMLNEAHGRGIRLFVVSNKPRHISLRILEQEGMLSLFTSILTRDSYQPPYGSKAQMIEHLLGEFRLSRNGCVVIGDTTEDADAAAVMALPFVYMTHGYGRISSGTPLVLRVDSFPDLLPALVKEFSQ